MAVRSNNQILMKHNFLRNARKIVLGRRIVTLRENATAVCATHESRGPTPLVNSIAVDAFSETR